MKDVKIFEIGWVRVSFAWYDIWVGAFVDTVKRKVYVCPLPFVLVTVKY